MSKLTKEEFDKFLEFREFIESELKQAFQEYLRYMNYNYVRSYFLESIEEDEACFNIGCECYNYMPLDFIFDPEGFKERIRLENEQKEERIRRQEQEEDERIEYSERKQLRELLKKYPDEVK